MESKYNGDTNALKAEFTQVIHDFLHGISFKVPDHKYDFSLVNDVVAYLRSENVPEDFIGKNTPLIHAGVSVGITFYPYLPPDAQRATAIFSALAFIMEENTDLLKADMTKFSQNLLSSQAQENSILRCLTKWLSANPRIFGPYAANMMLKEAIEYTIAFIVEKGVVIPTNAPDFAEHFRLKTGAPESFGFFAFPEALYPEEKMLHVYLPAIPALVRFINQGNDLLSLYKEVLDGETHNCVYAYARTHGVTIREAMEHYAGIVQRAAQGVRDVLRVHSEMQEHVEQFIQGYIFWHLALPRYRLCELGIQGAKIARERLYGNQESKNTYTAE